MQLPQERDGLQWDELRPFVGSAALYFDFAHLVDCTETFSNELTDKPLLQRLSLRFSMLSMPLNRFQKSHYPHAPTSGPVPRSILPERPRKVVRWQEQKDGGYVSIRRDSSDKLVW